MATKKTVTTKKPMKHAPNPRAALKANSAKPASKTAQSTTKPATPAKKIVALARAERVNSTVNKQLVGFVDFLREQSVVGLAIGLVMGTQVKQLVDSLLNSFINPLIGLVLPGQGTLSQKAFVLHLRGKSADFTWGSFVATLISFVTVAAVVYFAFKALQLDKLTKKKDSDKADSKTSKSPKKK